MKPYHLLLTLILVLVFVITGCSNGATDTKTVTYTKTETVTQTLIVTHTPSQIVTNTPTEKQLTLADAPDLLNLLPFLPSRFYPIDAANEGLSNAQMGLGSDCSEVMVFLSDDPYQLIYCFFGIDETKSGQASTDAMLRDEDSLRDLIAYYIELGALEKGFVVDVPTVDISYPNIGNLSVLAEGFLTMEGFTFGFDFLGFRSESVFIFIYSLYYSSERSELTPIGYGLEQRLIEYSF
ncbi:hypothetical protein ACFLYS_03250 [Chloroflexota bacterium]